MKTTCLIFLLNLLCLTPASARPVAHSEPVSGIRHAVVIFAKFMDEIAPDAAPAWAKDLFDRDLPGSLSHFYAQMSFGQFTLDGAVLPKRYASDHPAEYYGDEGYGVFNREILTKVDQEVDFGAYDNDGPDGKPNSGDDDGYVDFLFINLNSRPKRFYDAELKDATGIALLGLSEDFITDDPNAGGAFIRIRREGGTTQWVWCFSHAVGSMAHEFGHTLGLRDLYDTEYEGPEDDSAGIGNWGLMGRGTLGWHGDVDPDGPVPFSAWSRLWLGWIGELVDVKEDMNGVRLEDVALGGKVVKIQISKYEYFLLENRQPSGSYYDRDIPQGGLLIWHTGPGANWWEENKRADLECPDGLYRDRGYPDGVEPDPVFGKDNLDFWAHDTAYRTAHNGNLGDATDVFDGVRYTAFGPDTNPASTSNSGAPTGIYVRNIHFEGTTAVVDIHPRPAMVITEHVVFLDESGDHIIEAGEQVDLVVRLKNIGVCTVKGLQCKLRTNDPYVLPEDSVASFGDIPMEEAGMDTLRFKVEQGFQGRYGATLELEIWDGDGNVWMETIEKDFFSPHISLKGFAVLDGGAHSIQGFGNGDGVANPGETIGLQAISDSPDDASPFKVVFRTEDALVRQMGSSFLIASDASPGHRIAFETRIAGHLGTYVESLYVEVTGKDETPPQVLHAFVRPGVLEAGTAATINVPKQSIVEGGCISRMETRIYTASDSEWVDTVELQEAEEAFRGTWSYPGADRFYLTVFALDDAGNGMESPPMDYFVFCSPDSPAEPSSSGGWTTWTSVGGVTATAFEGSTLLTGTINGEVLRWNRADGTYIKYPGSNGPAGTEITSLLLDTSGNLWVRTWKGIYWYNGFGWKARGPQEGWNGSTVDAGELLMDRAGNLWCDEPNHLSRFDGAAWTSWTAEDIGASPYWRADALLEDHAGNIWAGGLGGVVRFDGTTWMHWTSEEVLGIAMLYVRALAMDDSGHVWAGGWMGRVGRFDGTAWTYRRLGGGHNLVNCMLSDGAGNMWVGMNKQVSRFDGAAWTHWSIEKDLGGSEVNTQRTGGSGVILEGVSALLTDEAGHVWAGTYGGGVSRFDGERWQIYSVEDGLDSRVVNTLALDPSGHVWAGTGCPGEIGGVSRFEDSGWTSWRTQSVLADNRITALLSDTHGDIWVATEGGVNRIHGSEWTYWETGDGLQTNWSTVLRMDGAGDVWMLTAEEGVWRFDGSGWKRVWHWLDGGKPLALFSDASGAMVVQLDTGVLMRFTDGAWAPWTTLIALENETVTCSLVDPFGNLWIGSRSKGLYANTIVARFDGTQWTTWSEHEGVVGREVTALLCDYLGNVWAGLLPLRSGSPPGGGVGRFDGSEWKVWTQEKPSSNYIFGLLMDAMGKVWIGSFNGVSRYDGTTWQSWAMEHAVSDLVEDPYGRIWAGGYGGLSLFDGSDWKRWAAEDGLASDDVKHLLADTSGRLWVGTDSGLSMYAPRTTGIAPTHQEAALPRSVVLSPNYPNPFNSTTVIRFELPETGRVRLVLYNVLGQRVRTLTDAKHLAGAYTVRWDGKDDAGRQVASGVYIGRLEAGGSVSMRKLVLLR